MQAFRSRHLVAGLPALFCITGLLVYSAAGQQADPDILHALRQRATRFNNLRLEVEWKEHRAPQGVDPWDQSHWETREFLDDLGLVYVLRHPDWRLEVRGGDHGGKFVRDYCLAWVDGQRHDFARHSAPKASVGIVSSKERNDSGFLSGFPLLTAVELDLFEYPSSLAEGVETFCGQAAGEELIDGQWCLKVVNTTHQDYVRLTWYFDGQRDFLPRRIELEHTNPKARRTIFWDYRCWSQRRVGQTYLPEEAVIMLRNPKNEKQPLPAIFHWRATSIAQLEVTDDALAVDFPAKTHVYDYVKNVRYEVGPAGQPVGLTKIDLEEQMRMGRAIKAQRDTPQIRRRRRLTFSAILGVSGLAGAGAAFALILVRRRQAGAG